MTSPTTAAGRALLAQLVLDVPWFVAGGPDQESAMIAAIEAEAVAADRASLVAAVEAAVTPWLRHHEWCNCQTDEPPDTERCKCGLRAAVLAILREPRP